MIARIQIPDEIAEEYQTEALARNITLDQLLSERLVKALPLDPRGRYIILEGRNRERLEERLGQMPVLNAEDLLAKVSRLARIKFGDHEIMLTAGQLEEIAWRAHKRDKPVEVILQETYDAFAKDFFTLVPGMK